MATCSRLLTVAVLLCVACCFSDCAFEDKTSGRGTEEHGAAKRRTAGDRGLMRVLPSYSCTVDQPSCHLEDLQCSTATDCFYAFPNLDIAIGMGIIYPLPTTPICRMNLEKQEGRCSCEDNQCVSYSKKFGSNLSFFYCGPCGFVGSQCSSNFNCTHEQSECQGSFCKCKRQGEFYELSYCKIPYVGYETALQIAIIVCIVLATFVVLTNLYNASPLRKQFGSFTHLLRCSNEESLQQPTRTDMPPAYDDVVEFLPTYQDALQMPPLGGHTREEKEATEMAPESSCSSIQDPGLGQDSFTI